VKRPQPEAGMCSRDGTDLRPLEQRSFLQRPACPGLPVKNTFIHFDVYGDQDEVLAAHGTDEPFRMPYLPVDGSGVGRQPSNDNDSNGQADGISSFWLPSLSSSSSSRHRTGSAHMGCSSRGSGKVRDPGLAEEDAVAVGGESSVAGLGQDSVELASRGSAGHAEGTCKPCAYWFKGCCAHGTACRHCHLPHDGQKPKRLRPSKQARQRMRNRMLNASTDEAPQDGASDCSSRGPGASNGQRRVVSL